MPKLSAGLLLFRRKDHHLEVLLVHPGGPFWSKKDLGVWSIPKGELLPDEDTLTGAIREFEEECGFRPAGDFFFLNSIRQAGGKSVAVWAVEGDADVNSLRSNTFSMEWPRHSRKIIIVPEVDRWEWFTLPDAYAKILPSQQSILKFLDPEREQL